MSFMKSIGECLNFIANEVDTKDRTIRYLREENKKLKSKAYKDNELKKMKEELDTMRDAYHHSFPVSEEEWTSIGTWMRKHEEEVHGIKTEEQRLAAQGCSGGRYSYIFTPTGLGISGVIRCICGAEFEFQEIG